MVLISMATATYAATQLAWFLAGATASAVADRAIAHRRRRKSGVRRGESSSEDLADEAARQQGQGVEMMVSAGKTLRADEAARLQRLCEVQALGMESNRHLDDVTTVLSWITDVPIALVSLVTAQKLCFTSRFGLDARVVPREEHSLCSWCIAPKDPKVLIIDDASEDERTCLSGIVAGPPYVRFYAGCPLQSADGYPLGTLCLIDQRPRHISASMSQLLVNLAEIVTRNLERYEVESSQSLTSTTFADGTTFTENTGSTVSEEDNAPSLGDTLSHISSHKSSLSEHDDLADFKGGSLRRERVEESLTEAHILVAVDTTSTTWTILYGDCMWTKLTSVSILPPTQAPSCDDLLDHIHWWQVATYLDESGLDMANGGLPREDMVYSKYIEDGNAFHLNVLLPSVSLPAGCFEASVRCVPADVPLDCNAAAIDARLADLGESRRESFARLSDTQRLYFFIIKPTEDMSKRSKTIRRFLKNRPNVKMSLIKDVKLMKVLGSGSFAKVYLGSWMGSPVAVKVLRRRKERAQAGSGSESMFEASLSSRLSHPHIVQTYEFSSQRIKAKPTDDMLQALKILGESHNATDKIQLLETVIVQEWCDRGTLGQHVKTHNLTEAKNVQVGEVVAIAAEIASALAYMHERSVVHGDLSSNNVLLQTRPNSRGYACKICDFGLSRAMEQQSAIHTKSLGTVRYMPPEMLSTFEPQLTVKVDIYSTGVILHEVITGRVPWATLSPPQVVLKLARGARPKMPEGVPQGVLAVVEHCMATSADDRPDARALVQEVDRISPSTPAESEVQQLEVDALSPAHGR